MASFTEQATLQVVDQSSAQIKKINAALASLFKTASSLKSVNINISVNDKGIQKAITNMRSLKREMDRMGGHGGATKLNVSVNTAGLAAAQKQINALRAQAQKPIAVTAATPRGGPRMIQGAAARPAGAVPVGLGRAAGVAGRGLLGGAGLGGLAGSAQATASLWALSAAARAAGSALASIGKNAMERDRQSLASNVTATKAQQKIWEDLGGKPTGPGGRLSSETEFRELRRSLLGDVTGTDEEKAKGADTLARHLVDKVLPGIYARNPNMTPDQAQEGLRKLAKSVNLSTGELLKNNEITAEGMRTFNAIATAQAADPELSAALVKTTLANLKTSAYSLDEAGLTRVLLNAGSRGARAANEQFQAQLAAGGTVDVKQLNNALAGMGLLADVARNKKGNVIAASGTPVDNLLLQQDPGEWFHKHFTPKMDAALKAKGIDEKSPQYNAEAKSYIERAFPGMRQTAKQAIADLVLGYKQTMASMATGKTATGQDVNAALDKSTKAQVDMLQKAWKDAGANIGERIQQTFPGLPDAISRLTGFVERNPVLSGAAAVGAPLVGAGLVAAGPAIALTGSAWALKGAAWALSAAAGKLGGAGLLPGGLPGGKTPPVVTPPGGKTPPVVTPPGGKTPPGGTPPTKPGVKALVKAGAKGALRWGARIAGYAGLILSPIADADPAGGKGNQPELNKHKDAVRELGNAEKALYSARTARADLEKRLASGEISDPGRVALAKDTIEKLNAEIERLTPVAEKAAEAVRETAKAAEDAAKKAEGANKKVSDAFDALKEKGIKVPEALEEPKPRPFPQPVLPPPAKGSIEAQRLKALEDVDRESQRRQKKAAEQEQRDAADRRQRDKQRGDPTDIWKNLPPAWQKPPPVYPDGVSPGGPVKTMFDTDQPIPIKADQPISVIQEKPAEKAPEWAPAPPSPGGAYPGGVPKDVGPPITTLPEINVQPLSDAASSLSGSLESGASSIMSAGSSLESAGAAAAGAIENGASSAGAAYGNAAAGIIRSAVANVTISVQHSGNAGGGGGGKTGNSTAVA